MPLAITCSHCDKKLKVPDAAAGKKIRCPACKGAISVPAPEDELVEPDDDLVEPDEEVAVRKAPPPLPKKARDDEDEPRSRKKYRDDEDEDRPRKKKKKRFDDGPRRRGAAHRGVLIMCLGFLSVFVSCAFVITWLLAYRVISMADEDLAQMSTRRMDPSGRGMTQTGKVLAFVACRIEPHLAHLGNFFESHPGPRKVRVKGRLHWTHPVAPRLKTPTPKRSAASTQEVAASLLRAIVVWLDHAVNAATRKQRLQQHSLRLRGRVGSLSRPRGNAGRSARRHRAIPRPTLSQGSRPAARTLAAGSPQPKCADVPNDGLL